MKNYLFDFDGTIADTLALGMEIANHVRAELKLEPLSEQKFEELRGMTILQALKAVEVPARHLPQLAVRSKKELTARLSDLHPVKGMPEVLRALHERPDVVVGLVSSNSKTNIYGFLDRYELRGCFNFIETGVTLFGKSRRLKSTLRRHRLDRAETVYVGDEVRDIEASHEVGLAVASVVWGFNNEEVLATRNPDFLISHPQELLDIT